MGFPSGWAGLITPRPRGSDLRAPNGLGARLHNATEISHPSPPWGVQTDGKPETGLGIGGRGLKRPSHMLGAGGFLDPRPALYPVEPATGDGSRVETDSLEVIPVDSSSLLGPSVRAQKSPEPQVLHPHPHPTDKASSGR